MIACVSPGNYSSDYTLNTLQYASMLKGNRKKATTTSDLRRRTMTSLSPKRRIQNEDLIDNSSPNMKRPVHSRKISEVLNGSIDRNRKEYDVRDSIQESKDSEKGKRKKDIVKKVSDTQGYKDKKVTKNNFISPKKISNKTRASPHSSLRNI